VGKEETQNHWGQTNVNQAPSNLLSNTRGNLPIAKQKKKKGIKDNLTKICSRNLSFWAN
jgi:hypothetical protein